MLKLAQLQTLRGKTAAVTALKSTPESYYHRQMRPRHDAVEAVVLPAVFGLRRSLVVVRCAVSFPRPPPCNTCTR